jgi:hypothetical protein
MKAHISVADAMNFVSKFVPEQNRQEDRVMIALFNEVKRLRGIIDEDAEDNDKFIR